MKRPRFDTILGNEYILVYCYYSFLWQRRELIKGLFALNVGGSTHIGIVETRIWKALQRNTSSFRSLEYFNANVIFLATSKCLWYDKSIGSIIWNGRKYSIRIPLYLNISSLRHEELHGNMDHISKSCGVLWHLWNHSISIAILYFYN